MSKNIFSTVNGLWFNAKNMSLLKDIVAFVMVFLILSINGMRDAYDAVHNDIINDVPYQAFITTTYKNKSFLHSSGAVISSHFVITSYNAVVNGTEFKIRLGTLRPFLEDPIYNGVTTIPPHYRHIKIPLIALLQFPEEIPFSRYIQKVTLPTPSNEVSDVSRFGNDIAIASGYEPDGIIHSPKLRYLDLKIVPLTDCDPLLNFQTSNTTLCARGIDIFGKPKGTLCEETGNPLAISNTLIGIFDDTTSNCTKGGPYKFIKIEPFVDFILKTIFKTTISKRAENNSSTATFQTCVRTCGLVSGLVNFDKN